MEFLCLFHQTQRFTIAFRIGHTKITLDLFFQIPAFLLTNDRHRPAFKKSDTAHDGRVILYPPVPMKLHKILKNVFDIIKTCRTIHFSGNPHSVPCTKFHMSFASRLFLHGLCIPMHRPMRPDELK